MKKNIFITSKMLTLIAILFLTHYSVAIANTSQLKISNDLPSGFSGAMVGHGELVWAKVIDSAITRNTEQPVPQVILPMKDSSWILGLSGSGSRGLHLSRISFLGDFLWVYNRSNPTQGDTSLLPFVSQIIPKTDSTFTIVGRVNRGNAINLIYPYIGEYSYSGQLVTEKSQVIDTSKPKFASGIPTMLSNGRVYMIVDTISSIKPKARFVRFDNDLRLESSINFGNSLRRDTMYFRIGLSRICSANRIVVNANWYGQSDDLPFFPIATTNVILDTFGNIIALREKENDLYGDRPIGVNKDYYFQPYTNKNDGTWRTYIDKITTDGVKVWTVAPMGQDIHKIWGGISTRDGGFVLYGTWCGVPDPSVNDKILDQASIIRFDSMGKRIWQYTFGKANSDEIRTAAELENGDIVAAGTSRQASFMFHIRTTTTSSTYVNTDIATEQSFSVYPNPASNNVSIVLSSQMESECSAEFPVKVELLNMQGDIVKTITIHTSSVINFDKNTLPVGAYVLRCMWLTNTLQLKSSIQKIIIAN